MLQSSFAVAFLALAAIPGHKVLQKRDLRLCIWTLPQRLSLTSLPLNSNCVRSCAAGEEQGCPTLCKKLTMPEGWCAANNSGACWCTRDDTKSFIDADRPVDKRDEIKTYRETKA
ncbi:hypothetical protein JMJ77_0004296 [Colletotrichum scovillei]|uniref:Uncharacterized protein n=1 Tax=Colletotrichum scovillei TaxID=1209932 RepID=A0A9P7QZG9_9PEZI|nr:hypothetical protein JMJ77_0004296 [Colletotrichum scovillei]KAG7049549.1 hypothetical protein JMJ78_0013530 [Colletotrichum scovillei]KAG7064289.1 hypothetical protein JMJ76_0007335 [Colletotrichum scovillei]